MSESTASVASLVKVLKHTANVNAVGAMALLNEAREDKGADGGETGHWCVLGVARDGEETAEDFPEGAGQVRCGLWRPQEKRGRRSRSAAAAMAPGDKVGEGAGESRGVAGRRVQRIR